MNQALLARKGKDLGELLLMLPTFVLISIPLWTVVLIASVLAEWFYAKGWWPLGALFRLTETVVGIAGLLGTLMFALSWSLFMLRVLFGSRRGR